MSFAAESPSEIFLICTFQLFVMQGRTNGAPFASSTLGLRNQLDRRVSSAPRALFASTGSPPRSQFAPNEFVDSLHGQNKYPG
jgi:hypothetical protein